MRGNCVRGRGYLLYIQRGTEDQLMSVTLHRWGNSVGLRLPKPLLEQLGLKEGSEVDIRIEGNRLVVEPTRRRRYTMAELLEGMTPDNKPEEVDWGPPVGREVW
jgi:antitoxin MazE